MDAAHAQTTCSQAIANNINAQAVETAPGVWKVVVTPSTSVPLDVGQIAAFAVANGLTGSATQIVLV